MATLVFAANPAQAQSMVDSLASAYTNNPQLNVARSKGRSTDENVSIALSGYRPRFEIDASTNATHTSSSLKGGGTTSADYGPHTVSLVMVQPLFTGFQVSNSVNQAEAGVKAQREVVRSTEQSVLFDAASQFVDVIRDSSIVSLQDSNIKFLSEQLRAAKDRFAVGEGTKTDTAQADARLQLAISQLNAAKAQLAASRASFRQATGLDAKNLRGNVPVERLIPKSVEAAVDVAQKEHPAILAGIHNIDVASANVKVLEGSLLPSVNLQGSVSRSWNTASTDQTDNATIGLNLRVPLYQGGGEYSKVRQAKEDLGTARIQVDLARDQVRAAVVTAWGQLDAASASISAAVAQVAASQLALSGVIEEQRVGQRTTLDVLNAQSDLITARVGLVTAERNKTVAAFSLVAAVGRLDANHLNLPAARYNTNEHYEAVRDKWFGLRTPDGR